jgi:Asp-tRNA(Asn)/Glu-tRNA(Gln) amidotransferase A subunit family amidase
LQQLNIVPLSISYEYDPCDYLKAKEFQQRRDNPDFKKSMQDDLESMATGIFGYKGHVHYQAAACMNDWLGTLDDKQHKTELYPVISAHIDREIHSNYRLYANNYIAYDHLHKSSRFSDLYTEEEEERFEDYLKRQIAKIDLPNPDLDYLEYCILKMYSNPLQNYLAAAEAKEL